MSSNLQMRMKKSRGCDQTQAMSRFINGNLKRYKIGDSFLSLPVSEIQTLLEESTTSIDEEVAALEKNLDGLRGEMDQLKVALYARFGKSINLES